ncbi:MAG: response regulator transcription factor [Mucilaginibacter sp.]|nr:response regulator transcription factor [Mucilaginibacter sp.]
MKIIIIEDELLTAEELKSILENFDADVTVEAILTSVAEAKNWFNDNQTPDLVFADVRLGDGLSFDIFRQVQTPAPVIFCTAYDKYAIKAFEHNGIDYLLKPIDRTMVEKSLNKYKRVKAHLTGETIVSRLDKAMALLEPNYKQSILVRFANKIVPVKTADIQYVYAAKGNAIIHQTDNQDYIADFTIEQLEQSLNPKIFFKANRQYLINREIIENIEHYFNRRLVIKTSCPVPEKIIVSRDRAQEFLRWIEQ